MRKKKVAYHLGNRHAPEQTVDLREQYVEEERQRDERVKQQAEQGDSEAEHARRITAIEIAENVAKLSHVMASGDASIDLMPCLEPCRTRQSRLAAKPIVGHHAWL